MKKIALVTLISLFCVAGYAKDVKGIILDNTTQEPLLGATVRAISTADTTKKYFNTTDLNGNFTIKSLPKGSYRLVVTFVGYQEMTRSFTMAADDVALGRLRLKERSIALNEATAEGRAIRATQSNDTISYNADAFKTIQGGNAEDLVAKMPGVVVQNGAVQAQGEQVKKVLVDGKEFFEGDPTTALRNLPTDIIQSIQVFDRQSDESQFTGFNDGNTTKTINVVTKEGKAKGVFGKFAAGIGTDSRYSASGSFSHFNGDERITLLAMTNNVNQQNFSQDDLMGSTGGASRGMGGGRSMRSGGMMSGGGSFGGGSNFGVGQLNGITQTHAGGLNYSNNWNNKLTLSGNYFITYGDNNADQLVNRRYFDETNGLRQYNEATNSNTTNVNHRFNARMEWTLDSSNAILFYPTFNIQNTNSDYNLLGNTWTMQGTDSIPVNATINNNRSTGSAYNAGGMLMYRHKMAKVGRTISIGVNGRASNADNDNTLYALNQYYTTVPIQKDTSSQFTPSKSPSYTLGGNMVYTEPINKNSMLMFNYNFNYTYSERDKRTYNLMAEPDTIISGLSSKYDNNYMTHNAGLGYRFNGTNFFLTANVNYQRADLRGDLIYPQAGETNKGFNSILPFVMLDFRPNKENQLRVFFRTNTNAPSITQLQRVIDNSNPLFLSSGNAALDQEYNTSLFLRYTNTRKGGQTFVAMLGGSNRSNYIGDSTFVAKQDTDLGGGITLKEGSQFSKPVNLSGYYTFNSMLTYGFPLIFMKSNLNLNANLTYSRLPGIYNGQEQVTNNWAINPGFVMSSNISDKLDFTLSYNATFNDAKNNLLANANATYLNQRGNFKINWIFGKAFTFENNLGYSGYTGMSNTTYDQQFFLWNMSVGKKFLKNNAGEIKLSVFDILKQNKSINRNVTTMYYEDVLSNVMPQYFMLSFTYTLRSFKGKMPTQNNQRRGHPDGMMMGPPPGV